MRLEKFLLLLLLTAPYYGAGAAEVLRLEPLPEVVALAAAQPLSLEAQLELALILSGVAPSQTASGRTEFVRWQRGRATKLPPGLSEGKSGEFVLEFLNELV